MINEKEIEPITRIDEHHLDKECIRLPSDYHQRAFAAAEAKKDVQEAKAYLDVVQAELSMKIRNDPEKFGLEKITEAAVTNCILTHPRFQEAQKALFGVQYHSELCQAVVWALECKKRSLTLLVDLHGLGYFADVKVSAAGKEAVEQMTQRQVRRRHQEK